ncbi:phage minor head protein [Planotetraspora sp. GP83]|uniref:phage minor head protein n=1 Tax=Planotetraspora sp. GP83 TaxID=3156264 RepID=UPI00351624CC
MSGKDPRQVARDTADRTLTGLERMVQRAVAGVLDEVAEEFARSLEASGLPLTVVAAALAAGGDPIDDADLRRPAELWRSLLRRILAALLAVWEAAFKAVLRRFDVPPPPGSDDLVSRWLDDSFSVPEAAQQYMREAENRLSGVGDALWDAARRALADGMAAGEGADQLRKRLQRTFAEDGVELGDTRAERIARTETAAAWNRAALDGVNAMPPEVRPTYKTWLATMDTRTRPDHWAADGQTVLVAAPFLVDGEPLMHPGDPIASPANLVNCRCTVTFGYEPDPPPDEGRQYLDDAQIRRVVDYFEEQGIVRDAHTRPDLTAATGGPYTGSMVSLVPSAADLERLAVDGGLPPEELHCTLLFLGEADAIDAPTRAAIIDSLRSGMPGHMDQPDGLQPLDAEGFAISAFNPHHDDRDTCIVLGVGGLGLTDMHRSASDIVSDVFDLPDQHTPWIPHVTLTYTDDLAQVARLADRAGPIVFDRLRISFAGEVTDIPLGPEQDGDNAMPDNASVAAPPRRWSTPDDTGLAFENQETGDGRIFAPNSLYWESGPWPLQYADEMLGGHEGAELAGAIDQLSRDGDRIPGAGVLYTSQPSGQEAVRLLEQGAPLGVSVDLDDVDIEFIDRSHGEGDGEVVLMASYAAASALPLPGGSWLVSVTSADEIAASGGPVRTRRAVQWTTLPDGAVPVAALRALAQGPGVMTAAAGDADDPERGQVLFTESSGDFLMRITRGRVRGATLVTMPAFDRARIVLDPADDVAASDSGGGEEGVKAGPRMSEVVAFVASSPNPVTAAQVADHLGMSVSTARDYLGKAVKAGKLVRIALGLYVGAATLPEGEVSAAACGDLELPIHEDRDAGWDGDKAGSRVLDWATAEDGSVDAEQLARAFLYRDPDADPATLGAYKLGMADVVSSGGQDRLEIIPNGVVAAAGALQGARGGVDIPEDDQEQVRRSVSRLYERIGEKFGEPMSPPWDGDNEEEVEAAMAELEASAWTAMQDMPPMPAGWFREPTEEELPPGSGGVHYRNGRIFGWVAQAGEPHAGYPNRKLTIESLGDIDLTHFLRAKFPLNDGTFARVGAFTMNVPHTRDGAECENAACQWDDTRTVAGIVTVGMNSRGMWFSGAAAPWLAEWDRRVFTACQPSYHMRQGRDGRWQLRAVLSVPVPGHSSPLAASAVAHRANVALAASAAAAQPPAVAAPVVAGGDLRALAAALVTDTTLVDDLLTAMEVREQQRAAARAEIARLQQQVAPARAEIAASMSAQIKEGTGHAV